MPNAPGTTIAAIAFDTKLEDYDGLRSIIQVIALVEADKVVAANRSIIEEDAVIAFGGYRIDTARYILSRDVRAFGVLFHSHARGARCPEGGDGESMTSGGTYLTLWIRESEHLRAIFNTSLYHWTSLDGHVCRDDVRIIGARITTIGVERTSSNGFADLSITVRVTQEDYSLGEITDKRTVRKVLKYDGQSYGIEMFNFFWDQ
ncbi:MAG: multidrug ABC transporter ATPase [Betaproteobacteria bacterium]|nr:multidrug ABC transporter ATPase [Betaproteobacteria bacterium]